MIVTDRLYPFHEICYRFMVGSEKIQISEINLLQGIVLFKDALNTFSYGYMASDI